MRTSKICLVRTNVSDLSANLVDSATPAWPLNAGVEGNAFALRVGNKRLHGLPEGDDGPMTEA